MYLSYLKYKVDFWILENLRGRFDAHFLYVQKNQKYVSILDKNIFFNGCNFYIVQLLQWYICNCFLCLLCWQLSQLNLLLFRGIHTYTPSIASLAAAIHSSQSKVDCWFFSRNVNSEQKCVSNSKWRTIKSPPKVHSKIVLRTEKQ